MLLKCKSICWLWLLLHVTLATPSLGQTTYHWIASSGSWTTGSNWSPQRTSPLPSDILIFDTSGNVVISNVPSQTVQSLVISENTTVSLLASGSAKTISITNTLQVDPNSQLLVSGTEENTLTIPELQDSGEIPTFSVQDGGNNTLVFKFGKSRNTLFNSTRIIGMGSSTMYGSGATTGFKLHERLKTWVQATLPGGEFFVIAQNGFYSNHFLPDGETAESRWSKNILAALDMEPDIIVLSLPTNDIAFHSVATFMANLQRIDEVCKERNIHLFVTTTQPRNDYSVAQQQLLYNTRELILNHFGERAIDVFTPVADPYTPQSPARIRDIYNADNIHLNNDGHAVLADLVTTALTNYFTDPDYTTYSIERSTNPTNDFTVFAEINSPATSFTTNTQSGDLYYYRLRAQTTTGEFTGYSPVVALQQPLLGGVSTEQIQINFSNQANQQNIPQWNEFIPSGGVADIGEERTNLTTVSGQATTVGIVVTGTFPSTSSSGGRGGTFPTNVIRSCWVWGADNSTDKPALRLTGLQPNTLYNIRCLFSNLATADYRYVGFDSQGKGKAISANHPVAGSNDAVTADLIGLTASPTGEIDLRFRALPTAGIGYLNAMIVEQLETVSQRAILNLTLATGASIDVGGAVTMIDGTFSAESNTITLHSNPTPLKRVNGRFLLGQGTVLHVGKISTPQSTAMQLPSDLFSTSTTISEIVMAYSGGLVLGNQPITVRDHLELNSGNIITNETGKLVLESTALPLTESTNSRVEGVLELKSFAAGTTGFQFAGLTISSGADDLGNVTIVRKTGILGINTVNAFKSIAATWDINAQFQPTAGRQISLSWLSALDNDNNSSNRFIVYRSTTPGIWEAVAPLAFLNTVTADSRTTAAVTTTHFSSWTASEELQPLPVVWKKVYAEPTQNQIVVRWETATESNTSLFEIEKMNEEKTFMQIGSQPAAGTSQQTRAYSFTDLQPRSGLNYYRLKQLDLDGQFAYSNVVSCFFENSELEISVFPNPTHDLLTIRSYSDSQKGNLQLIDQTGRPIDLGEWTSATSLSLREKMIPPGVYQAVVGTAGKRYSFKIVVLP